MHAIARILGPSGWVLLPAAALLALSGCETEPDSHLVSAPPPAPPAIVQTTTTPAVVTVPTSPTTVVVAQVPPAPQPEDPPPRPSADYVWVGGYWTWNSSQYVWTVGHWEVPPRQGATWVPPRWDQEGNADRFYNGYWS